MVIFTVCLISESYLIFYFLLSNISFSAPKYGRTPVTSSGPSRKKERVVFQTGAEMQAALGDLTSRETVGLEEVVSVGRADMSLRLTLPSIYTRKSMFVSRMGLQHRKNILRVISLAQSGAELNGQTYSLNTQENCIEINFSASRVYSNSFFNADSLNSPFINAATGIHSTNWDENDITVTRNALIDLTATGNLNTGFNCKVVLPLREEETAINLNDAFIAGCNVETGMTRGTNRPPLVVYWYVFDVELESRDAQQTIQGTVYVPPFVPRAASTSVPDQNSPGGAKRSRGGDGSGGGGGGFGFSPARANFVDENEDGGSVGLFTRFFRFLFGGD